MPMAEKIRIALIKRNMSLKELSSRLGCTSQNLSGKLKRDNFSERELIEIADAINTDTDLLAGICATSDG